VFQAEDGIRDRNVTGVQTCALPIFLQNCTLAPIWVRKMPKKEAEALAMHYLERVRIAEHAHKFPGQISGGQQQRVAIARSLCMKIGRASCRERVSVGVVVGGVDE